MLTVTRTVSFVRGPRGRKRLTDPPPADPPPAAARIPRIARLMALSLRFEELVRSGEVADRGALARAARVTESRVTQVLGMCLLAPDIEPARADPDVPLIDAAAHEAYRRRHAELRDEEDRAERAGDAAGLAAAREEMRDLAAELARAVGLGGRIRGRSDADRVRKSVSMAVARDIDRIADSHPDLGRHLRRSVSSGFVLRYAPDVPNVWSTEFFPTNPDATDFVALPQEL